MVVTAPFTVLRVGRDQAFFAFSPNVPVNASGKSRSCVWGGGSLGVPPLNED